MKTLCGCDSPNGVGPDGCSVGSEPDGCSVGSEPDEACGIAARDVAIKAEGRDIPLRLGILGCGNMGGALAEGVQGDADLRRSFSLHVYARRPERAEAMRRIGAVIHTCALSLAREADILVVAVKPYQIAEVLREISPALEPPALSSQREEAGRIRALPDTTAGEKIVISLAAGVPLAVLRASVGERCPVARVMPNTLVAVGQGFFGLCFDEAASAAQRRDVRGLFSSLGQVAELPDDKINAFAALAGCGPAYVFYFMESLADAGVSMGLSRSDAQAIALSLLKGSAELAARSALHPSLLREQVTSPGGTTIAGLNHLDRCAVRGHVIDAVRAAFGRGKEMEESAGR